MRTFLVLLVAVTLSGCGIMPISKKDQKVTFTYDYEVPSVGREELWVRARDYFAETYGDSRSVLRVQDREEATLIGRGAAIWMLALNNCATKYKLQFRSKDEKARLRLEILEGVPAYSECKGYPLPTKSGYKKIVGQFESLASGLEEALKQKDDGFSDF